MNIGPEMKERYFTTMVQQIKKIPPRYTYQEAMDRAIVFRDAGRLTQERAAELILIIEETLGDNK